jgi:3-hydroxyisobutyrate dehydrogenase-like beta-hydroxyacid dehydrogenase
MKTIGLIGLGNAGGPLGQRLLSKGYSLKVYDINPEAVTRLTKLGALAAASAKDATAEVTLTALPSSVEVRAATFGNKGILAGLAPGSILIDLSGTDPDMARELDGEIRQKGAKFLGGTLHADGAPAVTIPKGLLSIVVGGKEEVLEECQDILKDLAQQVIWVAEPWIPKALKICVIMFAVANSIITAEALTWLTAQGIDPRLFLSLLQTTGSSASASRVAGFFARNQSLGGALSNSYKDLHQALKVASDLNLPLPFTALANHIQEIGRAQGLARVNSSAAVAQIYETLTKVSLSHAVLDRERTFGEPGTPKVIRLGDGRKNT